MSTPMRRMRSRCCARAASGAAKQRDELAASYVEHGLLPGTRCASLARRSKFCRCRRQPEGAKFGACKLASGSRVSSHFHHTREELFYRGTEGSGTSAIVW
jgi:uncharacterized Fe-S radical SAM superfamily protein PflX